MKATVTNYGTAGFFPTCLGNIFLERMRPRDDIKSRQALKELQKFPYVEVKITEGSLDESPPDFSRYTINQLRAIARAKGKTKVHRLKKVDLIKLLTEEIHG